MTIFVVPDQYSTIQEAVYIAKAGDHIVVDASYTQREDVLVDVDNLTISAPASVTRVSITLNFVTHINLVGDAPINVTGSESSDIINGNNGNNVLADSYPSESLDRDTIYGGGGNDTIISREGSDTLLGGDGNDIFMFQSEYFYNGGIVDGGAGIDKIYYADLTRFQISNVEILDSTSVIGSIDQISSFLKLGNVNSAGKFGVTISGEGGTADLSKKTGKQWVSVYANDATSGVTIKGSLSNDSFHGSLHDDFFDGSYGIDEFYTSEGSDTLIGGAGNDIFTISESETDSSTNNCLIDGGAGVDIVYATQLEDYELRNVEILDTKSQGINGGSVAATTEQISKFTNIINSSNLNSPIKFIIQGKGGYVDLSYRITGGYYAIVDARNATTGVTVIGSTNSDTFFGTNVSDIFDGGAGADTFRSLAGFDILKGGAGNDSFAVNSGSGQLVGGADFDTVLSGNLGRYVVSEVEVLQTYSVKANAVQLASFSKITDDDLSNDQIEINLNGAGGTLDFSNVVRDENSILLESNYVTDDLSVVGSYNDDTLRGSDYDDRLDGGGGADVLIGGQGDDIFVTDGSDTIAEAANFGTDKVLSSVTLVLARNIENLTLTGSAGINGTGNTLGNSVVGNAGSNILDGGLGNDILRGNEGADSFLFASSLVGQNVDRIVDFDTAGDTIRLENSGVFTRLPGGALSAGMFKDITAESTVLDGNDYVLYDRNTGALYYDSDGKGIGEKIQFATLDNKAALTSADFLVV